MESPWLLRNEGNLSKKSRGGGNEQSQEKLLKMFIFLRFSGFSTKNVKICQALEIKMFTPSKLFVIVFLQGSPRNFSLVMHFEKVWLVLKNSGNFCKGVFILNMYDFGILKYLTPQYVRLR